MKQVFFRSWFLLALVLVLAAGFCFPQRLEGVRRALPQNLVVAIVLFVMSLPVEAGMMGQALRRPTAVLLAVAINFGLLPLTAWGVSRWLEPVDLAVGLLIAASVPCTLASAAVWTRRAGGNDSVATLVMIVTNLACFLVTPLWLSVTANVQASLPLEPSAMVVNLAVAVVLPILTAQLLRLYRPIGSWASRHKIALGVLAQGGILSMLLVGSVSCGLRLAQLSPGESLGAGTWAGMLIAVTGVHLSMLGAGHLLGWLLGIGREERIAVGFAGSQKTLMVGVHIALSYGGLAVLPMVAYHVCQLLVDTLVADRLHASALVNEESTSKHRSHSRKNHAG